MGLYIFKILKIMHVILWFFQYKQQFWRNSLFNWFTKLLIYVHVSVKLEDKYMCCNVFCRDVQLDVQVNLKLIK